MDDVIDSDIEARGFSLKTSYYLANASTCAYEEEPGAWGDRLGLGDHVRMFTCDEFHGFVGRLPEVLLVAFRGTESIENCLTDAQTPLVSCSPYPGRVHRGFCEGMEVVWPEIRPLLGPPSRSRPIWLTGHSLGGALATLASVWLASEGYAIRAVYTYGSPRVGDRLFRDFYRHPNYRFVNDNDLVPHLPFRWCYKHVGLLELLDNEGNLTEELAVWQDKKRAMRRKAKRIQRRHGAGVASHHDEHVEFDWLSDHRIDGYLDALKKLLDQASEPAPRDPLEDLLSSRAEPRGDRPFYRVDTASREVPPPRLLQGKPRKVTISETDLAEAFGRQPCHALGPKSASNAAANLAPQLSIASSRPVKNRKTGGS